MDSEKLICIKLNPQFKIMSVTKNGLRFLGYSHVKELEFKSISVLIPIPSAALHAQIFAEMQRTYTDKEKFFKISKLGNSSLKFLKDCTSQMQ
jgi:hypothetical protein